MELMPGNLYNLHPGSRLDQPLDSAIEQITQGLNHVMFPDMKTTVLLETMSGKGSEVGRRFEELKEILDRVVQKDQIGVCMDACHMWDSMTVSFAWIFCGGHGKKCEKTRGALGLTALPLK